MPIVSYAFKNKSLYLTNGSVKSIGVSRSSFLLAEILPLRFNKYTVLDLGCGVGYMSIGALSSGAAKVVAVDIVDTEKYLRENLDVNNLKQKDLIFIRSDLFSSIPKKFKFDVIIANLPQHALPANSSAKLLKGKYGGYDGTDIVCRALTEASYYLKRNGRYFGAISYLTNFKRTIAIAKSIYDIKVAKRTEKEILKKEMSPNLSYQEFLKHLRVLKENKLIHYEGDGAKKPIRYIVNYCQFLLKNV